MLLGVHGLEHASPLTMEVLAGARSSAQRDGIPIKLLASCSEEAMARKPEIRRRLAGCRSCTSSSP